MNDTELQALIALVNRETVLIAAENIERERHGYAVAYDESCGYTPLYRRLEVELHDRGIIQ